MYSQPNGLVCPFDPNNSEITLPSFFNSRGESIDAINDANTEPALFYPG